MALSGLCKGGCGLCPKVRGILPRFILLVSFSDTLLVVLAAFAVLKRLMVEKGLRGGISHAIHAFKNYDKSKNHHILSIGIYIIYIKRQCCLWMVLIRLKIHLNLK